VSGDTHNLGLLDIDETWVYEVTGTAVAGPYSNTGTATGTWTDSAGVDHTPDAATDDSGYFGAAPSISIDKITIDNTINVQGDGIWVNEGDSLTWQYTVKNTGNVALSNIAVTDDQQGAITSYTGDTGAGDHAGNGLLDTDETWTFTASGTAGDGTYTNTGTVTGEYTDSAGHAPELPITDSDDSGYVTTATLGHSKGYWANHAGTGPQANAWDSAADTNLVIGDGDPNGGAPDFSIVRAGAVVLMNTNTTGDGRLIFAGQAEAAQLNAYAAGVTANGLLDSAADWLNTAGGGQDDNDVVGGEYTVNKNSFSFVEGSKVSTSAVGGAWKGDAFQFTYSSNEDSGNSHTVHVTGEGLKNILEAYDLASGGSGLVVSSDGNWVGWMNNNVVSHVYANDPLAFAAVVNEAEHDILLPVNITGVYDNPNNYNVG
jgi:hypothetical protein